MSSDFGGESWGEDLSALELDMISARFGPSKELQTTRVLVFPQPSRFSKRADTCPKEPSFWRPSLDLAPWRPS